MDDGQSAERIWSGEACGGRVAAREAGPRGRRGGPTWGRPAPSALDGVMPDRHVCVRSRPKRGSLGEARVSPGRPQEADVQLRSYVKASAPRAFGATERLESCDEGDDTA
jgi:hypothetical protein